MTLASEIRMPAPRVGAGPGDTALRVAFFSDAFPERNGTGAYYHDLLGLLAGRVCAAQIFQPTAAGRRPRLSIPMPGDPGQRLATPPVRAIRVACDALRPDIVVVVTPGLYGLLGVWEARRRGLPVLAAFHTDFEQLARMYWNPVSRFFVNLVLRNANRIICRASRAVLINNAGLSADVQRLGGGRVEVIGTPLAAEFLMRPLVPIPGSLSRVCFAGRLAPEKNVEQVIAAARQLPDIEFLVAGDGPLRMQLEAQAAACANVRFMGWLNRSALISMLDSASLLLLPSAFETFGSVALEAMARGRPALVSKQTGIHAWPALRGGLFSLDEPRDLARRLADLANLPAADWAACSNAARAAAETLTDQTVAHWLQLLEDYRQPHISVSHD